MIFQRVYIDLIDASVTIGVYVKSNYSFFRCVTRDVTVNNFPESHSIAPIAKFAVAQSKGISRIPLRAEVTNAADVAEVCEINLADGRRPLLRKPSVRAQNKASE